MRNDHASSQGFGGGAYPSSDKIARHMARARRMRSEAVHGYLARAAAWFRGLLRPAHAPRGTVGQCC
jgi:hypothetical protein